eukprot:TRINITY_DN3644_c0_g1_i14.p1 TRINITY_DN3644_c0_g1~~TRINITY_DN3644_c0_g1_i14.p1  ORF type:complete len:866 (-),score=235.27 TRINITY_DN3644_c0_g1_i14:268-2865(-)
MSENTENAPEDNKPSETKNLGELLIENLKKQTENKKTKATKTSNSKSKTSKVAQKKSKNLEASDSNKVKKKQKKGRNFMEIVETLEEDLGKKQFIISLTCQIQEDERKKYEESLKQETLKWEAERTAMAKEMADKAEEITGLKGDLVTVQSQCDSQAMEHQQQIKAYQSLNESRYKERREEKLKYRVMLKLLRNAKNKIKFRAADLEKEVEKVNDEKDKLEENFKVERKGLIAEKDKLISVIDDNSTKISKLEKDLSQSKESLKSVQTLARTYKTKVELQNKELKILAKAKEDHKKDIAKLRADAEAANTKMGDAIAEKDATEEKNLQLKFDYDALHFSAELKTVRIENFERENRGLKECLVRVKDERTALKRRLEDAGDQIHKEKAKRAKLDHELDQANIDNQKLAEDVEDAEKENVDLIRKLHTKCREQGRASRAFRVDREARLKIENHLKEVQAENEVLLEEKKDFNEVKDNLEKENKNLKEKLETADKTNAELNAKIENVSNGLAEARKSFDEEKNAWSNLELRNYKILRELRKKLNTKITEICELKSRMNKKDEILTNLHSEVINQKSLREQQTDGLKNALEKNRIIQDKLERKEEELVEVKEALAKKDEVCATLEGLVLEKGRDIASTAEAVLKEQLDLEAKRRQTTCLKGVEISLTRQSENAVSVEDPGWVWVDSVTTPELVDNETTMIESMDKEMASTERVDKEITRGFMDKETAPIVLVDKEIAQIGRVDKETFRGLMVKETASPIELARQGNGSGIGRQGDGSGICRQGDGSGIGRQEDGFGIGRQGDGSGICIQGNGSGFIRQGNGSGFIRQGNGSGIGTQGDGARANGTGGDYSSSTIRLGAFIGEGEIIGRE